MDQDNDVSVCMTNALAAATKLNYAVATSGTEASRCHGLEALWSVLIVAETCRQMMLKSAAARKAAADADDEP